MRRWLMLLWVLCSATSVAAPPPGVAEQVSHTVLRSASSLNARMLMMIARGDVAGAVSMWQCANCHDTDVSHGQCLRPHTSGV